MKKSLLFFIILFLTCELFAPFCVKASNIPNFPKEVEEFLKLDDWDLFTQNIGKQINIKVENPIKEDFRLVIPDTVWLKKRPKKPIENKHYLLHYNFNVSYTLENGGTDLPTFNFKPIHQEFIIKAINHKNEKLEVVLFDEKSNKEILWLIKSNATISFLEQEQIVNEALKGYPLYIKDVNCHFCKYIIETSSNWILVNNNGSKTFLIPQIYVTLDSSNRKTLLYDKRESLDVQLISADEFNNYLSNLGDAAWSTIMPQDEKDLLFMFPYKCYMVDDIHSKQLPNDTIYIFNYNKDKRSLDAIYKQQSYEIYESHIIILRRDSLVQKAMSYLHKIGMLGREERKTAALRLDSLRFKKHEDEKMRFLHKKDSIIRMLRSKQICVVANEVCHPNEMDYEVRHMQIGKFFAFFNPFNKTIKYIDFKVVSKNDFGDIQIDEIGKSTASGRCIGPIQPNETNNYAFGDLFFNKREAITKIDLISLIITFTDNTTIKLNTKEAIETKTLSVPLMYLNNENINHLIFM